MALYFADIMISDGYLASTSPKKRLTYIPAFYLACIPTFQAFLFGIYSGILCGIYCGIPSGNIWHTFWQQAYLAYILAFYRAYIRAVYLA